MSNEHVTVTISLPSNIAAAGLFELLKGYAEHNGCSLTHGDSGLLSFFMRKVPQQEIASNERSKSR